MTNVQRHIQYLVASTDCVIIPGWGGLIACSTPARVDGGRFLPPSRTVVFNPALTHDDGILASSLCRREGISYDAARAEIASEVGAMHSAYDASGIVAIPRVGTFRRLSDSTMRFDADPTGVAGASYAALSPISLADLQPIAPASDSGIKIPRESIGKRMLRVAAFIAILLGLALTLSTPISVSLDRQADFAAVGSAPTHRRADMTAEPAIPATVKLIIAVPDSASSVVPTAARPAPEPKPEPDYYLIIGSLDSRAQAERWMARHSDTAIGIVERHGRYRVYAATGSSIEEASQLKSDPDFARRNPEAWVYRRR